MKKTIKTKALTLLSTGILIIATSQIFSYYFELRDLAKGSFVGMGIGLLIMSLIFGNFNTAIN